MRAIIDSNVDVEVVRKRPKLWRIKQGIKAPNPTTEQLTILEAAAKMFAGKGMTSYQRGVDEVLTMLKVNMQAERLTRIDPDLELLIDTDAFSYRPGPRQLVDETVLQGIRNAILGFNPISFEYRSTSGKDKRWENLHPYGILHGNNTRSYLLAYCDRPDIETLLTFTLASISNLIIHDHTFEKNPEISVENHLKGCFGVFRDNNIYDVVWHFDAQFATVISDWKFHPTQEVETLDDGRIEVRFSASGLYEMAWHIVTWGRNVTVVEPPELIETLRIVRDSIQLPE